MRVLELWDVNDSKDRFREDTGTIPIIVVPSVVTVLEERIKEVTMIIIADDSVVV
jgi:hypothetical protein